MAASPAALVALFRLRASLLAPRYKVEPARFGLDASESFMPQAVGPGFPAQAHRGDVEAELAAAKR